MILYGRVAVAFKVEESEFKKDKEKALNDALLKGYAQINNGDNYLPEDWNEDEEIITDDISFNMPVFPILGDSQPYFEQRIQEVSNKLREKEEKINDEENAENDPESQRSLENEANQLEGRLAELYLLKKHFSKKEIL